MKTSNYGKSFIKDEEGNRDYVYDDGRGNLTVGYGHKVVHGDNLRAGDFVPASRQESLFKHDIKIAENAVNDLSCSDELSQNQFDALVSIVFNGGPGVLRTGDMKKMFNEPHIFNSKRFRRFTSSDSDNCSVLVSNAFSYDRKLQPRRNREANLFCKGQIYTHKYPVYTFE